MRTPSNVYQSDPVKMKVRDIENIEYFAYVTPIYFSDVAYSPILQNTFMELLSWSGYSEG